MLEKQLRTGPLVVHNEGVEQAVVGQYTGFAPEKVFHFLEDKHGLVDFEVVGVGFEDGEGDVFWAREVLAADEVDDAGHVWKEGGVAGETAEDVVEDGGGVGVIRVGFGGVVEEGEGGGEVLLGF